MGWIVVGIGRLTGWETTTAEDAEDAGDCELLFPIGALEPLSVRSVATAEVVTADEGVFLACFFLCPSAAIASPAHAASSWPRPAGRLLVHFFDRASPALSSMKR